MPLIVLCLTGCHGARSARLPFARARWRSARPATDIRNSCSYESLPISSDRFLSRSPESSLRRKSFAVLRSSMRTLGHASRQSDVLISEELRDQLWVPGVKSPAIGWLSVITRDPVEDGKAHTERRPLQWRNSLVVRRRLRNTDFESFRWPAKDDAHRRPRAWNWGPGVFRRRCDDASFASSEGLYQGWLKMYDLKFEEAHQVFDPWNQAHPLDSLGPASDAAAYLFSELARLGTLETELFTDNSRFADRAKLHPDPALRARFNQEIERSDRLADAALRVSETDENALFAKSLTLGLRADYASLVDKQDLAALKFTKDGRSYSDRLMAADPNAYDAYLGPGVENYLLSLKSAPLRALLRATGARVDREKGLEQLRITALHGHYLEPFAKLFLAVAALRDKNQGVAKTLLQELHNRFPNNQLYLRELNRLK